jgi:glycosyltransferase involved in cell wall biosynthesis
MQPLHSDSINSIYIPHGIYNLPNLIVPKGGNQKNISKAVCIGFLRPSKNIEHLIVNFPEQAKFSLLIAGEAVTRQFGESLRFLSHKNKNIEFHLGRISQDVLLKMYQKSDFAIIPYRDTYNSGAALYALSIPVPIIATRSESMANLQEEVGASWVQLISQNFDSQELLNAIGLLDEFRNERSKSPLFSGKRQWASVGSEYSSVYRSQNAS